MPRQNYSVNDIFISIQGEGATSGLAAVFIRFAGCNLRCCVTNEGFQCDTIHETQRYLLSVNELLETVKQAIDQARVCSSIKSKIKTIILTGGEPLLQVDEGLLAAFYHAGYKIILETNGTMPIKKLRRYLSWIVVSPKKQQKTVIKFADEVKIILVNNQPLPGLLNLPRARAYTVSPAFNGLALEMDNVRWCISQVLTNPQWRLTLQIHKILGIP